jgi:hypothetical protein
MREDLSEDLIHFTQGSDEDAFAKLQQIIKDQQLLGSFELVKGQHTCVSFTEAPAKNLLDGFTNRYGDTRYSLFGIQVTKQWLFEQGGRPVIYQPEEDYRLLPPDLRWKHMTYELRKGKRRLDFLWEREWRIQTDALAFSQETAQIIVPSRVWFDRLKGEHDRTEQYEAEAWSVVLEDLAYGYIRPFTWRVICLDN